MTDQMDDQPRSAPGSRVPTSRGQQGADQAWNAVRGRSPGRLDRDLAVRRALPRPAPAHAGRCPRQRGQGSARRRRPDRPSRSWCTRRSSRRWCSSSRTAPMRRESRSTASAQGSSSTLAGDILTALHVVAEATSIKLTFADGSTSPAEVAVRRPENDIAVLQPSQLPAVIVPATLGNPNRCRSGARPTSSAIRSACMAR